MYGQSSIACSSWAIARLPTACCPRWCAAWWCHFAAIMKLSHGTAYHSCIAARRSLISQEGGKCAVTNTSFGNHFSASTLVDYWAEERHTSRAYQEATEHRLKPVSLVPPLRLTEYQLSTSAPATARIQQLQHCYPGGTVKAISSSRSLPTTRMGDGRGLVDTLERSCNSSRSSNAGLCSMTGDGGWSAKLQNLRGNTTARATAPTNWECSSTSSSSSTWLDSCTPGASIATTTLQQQKLEFQKHKPGGDR